MSELIGWAMIAVFFLGLIGFILWVTGFREGLMIVAGTTLLTGWVMLGIWLSKGGTFA